MRDKKEASSKYVFCDKVKSPIEMASPKEKGQYEILYYRREKNVLARQTIDVVE